MVSIKKYNPYSFTQGLINMIEDKVILGLSQQAILSPSSQSNSKLSLPQDLKVNAVSIIENWSCQRSCHQD